MIYVCEIKIISPTTSSNSVKGIFSLIVLGVLYHGRTSRDIIGVATNISNGALRLNEAVAQLKPR